MSYGPFQGAGHCSKFPLATLMLQFKDEVNEARTGKPVFDFRRPCTACALVQPAVLHRADTQVTDAE